MEPNRNTAISFDRLPAGSLFRARNSIWVKNPSTLVIEGIEFNAYDSESAKHALDSQNELVKCNMFPKEMIVWYDPEEERAQWSHES